METLKAESAKVVRRETLNTDPRTGAKTEYQQVDLTQPTRLVDFATMKARAKHGWAQNVKSGQVYAYTDNFNATDRTGKVSREAMLYGHRGNYRGVAINSPEDAKKWRKLDDAQAKPLIEAQIAATPKTFTETAHMITGALLPIWNRLKGDNRVYRITLDDGTRVLGRRENEERIGPLLEEFKIAAGNLGVTPEKVIEALNAGRSVRFADGTKLATRSVYQDGRFEITGPKAYGPVAGKFSERIQYELRYFIPKDDAAKAIEQIMLNNPVVEGIGGRALEAADPKPRSASGRVYGREARRLAAAHSLDALKQLAIGAGMRVDQARPGLELHAARQRYSTIDDAIEIKHAEEGAKRLRQLSLIETRRALNAREQEERSKLLAALKPGGEPVSMPEDQRAASKSGHPSPSGQPGEGIDATVSTDYESLSDETLATLPGDLADRARTFREAAAQIVGHGGADANRATSADGQGAALEEWARQEQRLIPAAEIDALPLVSNSTSEHEVHYRESDGRAVKRTWPGFYGQIPFPGEGTLDRHNATPAEYLRRMALQIAVFRSDLKLEGVSISDKPSMILGQPAGEPSIVVSQHWFEKEDAPSLPEIAQRLGADGFLPAPHSYFGWYRPADGVVIVDAKPDNFIQTAAGLVPIDLQMAVFTPAQLQQAGLSLPDQRAREGRALHASDPSRPVTPTGVYAPKVGDPVRMRNGKTGKITRIHQRSVDVSLDEGGIAGSPTKDVTPLRAQSAERTATAAAANIPTKGNVVREAVNLAAEAAKAKASAKDALTPAVEKKTPESPTAERGPPVPSEAEAAQALEDLAADLLGETKTPEEPKVEDRTARRMRLAERRIELWKKIGGEEAREIAALLDVPGKKEPTAEALNRVEHLLDAIAQRADAPSAPEAATKLSAEEQKILDAATRGLFAADPAELGKLRRFLDGPAVVTLRGDEFAKDAEPLKKRVAEWFAREHGGKAVHPKLGTVLLDERGVGDSLAHGIGRAKAAAFAAVPGIIERGEIARETVDYQGRGIDRVILLAPIEIAGKGYVAVVIVQRANGEQRFYLHEVGLKEALQSDAFKTGASASAEAKGEPSGASEGAIKSLLREIYTVNPADERRLEAADPNASHAQKGIELERVPKFVALARVILARGVTTPEGLAQFLIEHVGPYGYAMWLPS
jgi:hypothetical protein